MFSLQVSVNHWDQQDAGMKCIHAVVMDSNAQGNKPNSINLLKPCYLYIKLCSKFTLVQILAISFEMYLNMLLHHAAIFQEVNTNNCLSIS